ncbi:four helix bundle protein [Thiorhodospira sibirica]|uniref:four helix bundle protein n=1 Tax=Thiorhodospira sibirica TaxID=154347 RepID=UPI00022C1CDF|nr:four helix bundle protein [Thiorhodospira sibirica]
MRHLNYLPLWRDATRLVTEMEKIVREFPRYHKYTLGNELRKTTYRICQTIHRAHSRQHSRARLVQELSELIDDLKLQIQLAKEVQAFRNFSQFQRVAEQAVNLGRQAGGWLKQTRAEAKRSQSRLA